MIILAHRGIWSNKKGQNSMASFKKAKKLGYGLETDIWAYHDKIVISHDSPKGPFIFIEDLFKLDIKQPVALNVKSSGLEKLLPRLPDNYFLFDGSVPDNVKLIKAGHKVFTRESEYELGPSLYNESSGVWIDMFETDWVKSQARVEGDFKNKKLVALVSPELHGRKHESFWNQIKEWDHKEIMLCTDLPEEANNFFNT